MWVAAADVSVTHDGVVFSQSDALSGDDALLEFLFRCDADVAQDGAGKLGKEALDEIEPGAVLGREGEFEAAGGLLGEPSFGFLGKWCAE